MERTQLIPTAEVEASPGLALELGPELTLEVGPELHSRSQSRTCSRGQSRNHARANSQSCSHGDLQGMHPQSHDKPLPGRRLTFNDPEDEKGPAGEEAGCSTEPSIGGVETWLRFQAWQLGTSTWWEELGAIPGIKDLHKFA